MRLGIISSYELFRKGLCALIASRPNCSLVLDLPDVPEDLDILRSAQPEVLLLQCNGGAADLEVVSRLHNLLPKVKILLEIDKADEETELLALRAGARGCVSKSISLDTLLRAFVVIGRGEYWVTQGVATHAISKLVHPDTADSTNSSGLTPREWEILALLAKGARNKDIATSLSVSENTVKTHLLTIYRKVNVDCRLAATLYYFEHAKQNGKLHGKAVPAPAKRYKADPRPEHDLTPTG